MVVHPVACLKDNYAYLIHEEGREECVVVDPSEPGPVREALRRLGLRLVAILNTHHHRDHVGGNSALVEELGPLPVYGHRSDRGRIPELTEELEHDDEFEVAGLSFRVLHVPGHTLGAIAYVGDGRAFTGDTLFAAGCGRLFEGTAAQLYESLNERLGGLPDETLLYFGHEYTEANLRFAAFVEPENLDVSDKQALVGELRSQGMTTTPTTLADERATNPFLRCDRVEVRQAVHLDLEASPAEVFGRLRRAKDEF
ncbi:MAG: hydroxyacylglutathione hydrolase [Myxococcales bacterium]|nr:hydroxyacylglutathione hydrolase [Myxococcales bacterium]